MDGCLSHRVAKGIFLEIRDRPYAWACHPGDRANNCYTKGIELLQRLGVLGYGVRGQVGEIALGDRIPQAIQVLHPTEFPPTHFWVEILLDGQWKRLDASYDSGLARVGLAVSEWESNTTCFEVTRIFKQSEAINYQIAWRDPSVVEHYFKAIEPFASTLNRWYKRARDGSSQAG